MAQGACAGLERQEESLLVGMYSEPILGVLTKLNSPMSPALLRFASAQSLCVHRTSSALCQPTVARAPALRSCTRPCCCLKPPQQTIFGAMRPTIFPKALAGQLLSQRPTACRSACWLLCCAEVLQYLQRDRCALSGRRHRLAPHRLPAAPRLGCRCVAACPPMPAARPACMALSGTREQQPARLSICQRRLLHLLLYKCLGLLTITCSATVARATSSFQGASSWDHMACAAVMSRELDGSAQAV